MSNHPAPTTYTVSEFDPATDLAPRVRLVTDDPADVLAHYEAEGFTYTASSSSGDCAAWRHADGRRSAVRPAVAPVVAR